MFTKALLKKVFLLCIALSCVTTLVACGIGADAGAEDADNAPTLTQTLEPTLTPTSSPTPTETLTPTPTLEPTPIVEGNIEDLTENMEEGDIVWSMFELQKIVNAYDQASGVSFSEYIAEAKESISNEGNYERVYRILEKLEELGELNTMSLIYALKDAYPEIYFPDIPEGFSSLTEAFSENLENLLVECGKKIEEGKYVEIEYTWVYDGRAAVLPEINYEIGFFHNGTILVNGDNYEEGFPDFINTIILVKQIDIDGVIYPAGVMLDEKGQLRLVLLSNETGPKILSGSYQIYIVSDDALLEGVELPEGEREP